MRRPSAVFVSLLLFAVMGPLFFPLRAGAAAAHDTTPLRILFLRCDLLVVGKIGKAKTWEALPPAAGEDKPPPDKRAIPIEVEEILKGVAPDKLLVIDDNSLANGDEAEEAQEDFRAGEFGSLPEIKYRRLFFLKKDEETGLYRENNLNRSFLVDQADLEVYVSRLRELRNIYSQPEPPMEAVVEWLVSMAEDPNTRYDASHELNEAHVSLRKEKEEQAEEEAEAKEKARLEKQAVEDVSAIVGKEKNEGVVEIESPPAREPDTPFLGGLVMTSLATREPLNLSRSALLYGDGGDTQFARLITPAQKERLLQAFLGVTFTYRKKAGLEDFVQDERGPQYEPVLETQDRELLALAAQFHDIRLTGRLLNELPLTVKYDVGQAAAFMKIIAKDMDDDRLLQLAVVYEDIAWRADYEIIPAGAIPSKVFAEEGEEAGGEGGNESKKGALQATFITYGQLRPELLRRFIDRGATLMFERP